MSDPITRREGYLSAISSQLEGGSVTADALDPPKTREEGYLSDIAHKIASTIELPAVTAADNGDVLTVKNGKWDKGDAPSGLPSVTSSDNGKSLRVVSGDWAKDEDDFVVTFTKSGSTWGADVGEDVIKTAINAGKRVYGKVAGNLVTGDSYIYQYTLLVPLSGTSVSYGTVFSGSYQSANNTVYCTFIVYSVVVTAYTKTVALPELPTATSGTDDYKVLTASGGRWDKSTACFNLVYTISGLPVDGVYPLTPPGPLADILDLIDKGANIRATVTFGGETAILYPAGMGANYVSFSSVVMWDGVWCVFSVSHYIDESDNEGAQGQIVPISTVQMSYNSTTGALSMTNVPEENA